MLGRKTLEERIAATIRAEIEKILASLENDHREYLRRLRLKEKTQSALEEAEAEVRRLHSEKTALEKRFWEAHSEESEAALSEIESTSKPLERATKKAEKTLGKTRADFEKADFDEVVEGFALKAKATIAEDEVTRWVGVLEETLEDLLAGVSDEIKETARALRDEYKEPRFETAEERNSHEQRMNEILKALTESYAPCK